MDPFNPQGRVVVGIGLGGICEGWIYPLLLLWRTGVLPVGFILLVDGKSFHPHNRDRQLVGTLQNKAQDRRTAWLSLLPDAPLRFIPEYVTEANIRNLIPDGAIVLLSPDNHHTRKLVSDHLETLQEALLISAGNDAIDEGAVTDGTEAMAVVHYRREGRNITPPLTRHHASIATPADHSPASLGCQELVQAGQPQILVTNFLAGHLMIELLWRYCSLPAEQATEVVEVWGNIKTGFVSPYGIDLRPL